MLHLFLQSAAAEQTAGTSLDRDTLVKINWCNFSVHKPPSSPTADIAQMEDTNWKQCFETLLIAGASHARDRRPTAPDALRCSRGCSRSCAASRWRVGPPPKILCGVKRRPITWMECSHDVAATHWPLHAARRAENGTSLDGEEKQDRKSK